MLAVWRQLRPAFDALPRECALRVAVRLLDDGASVSVEGGRVWPKDSEIQLAVEEHHANAVRGDVIAMRAEGALDHTAKAKTSEIVGHLGSGIRAFEERGDAGPQVAVTEAGG